MATFNSHVTTQQQECPHLKNAISVNGLKSLQARQILIEKNKSIDQIKSKKRYHVLT